MQLTGKVFVSLCRMYMDAAEPMLHRFRKAGLTIEVLVEDELESEDAKTEVLKKIPGACAAVAAGVRIGTDEMETAGDNLKLISSFGSGIDLIDMNEASRRGIYVTNCRGGNAAAVAEMCITSVLALSRRAFSFDRELRRGEWAPKLSNEISGKTLGIVGMGAVGTEILRRTTKGFNMKVICYDVMENEQLKQEFGLEYVSFDELLARSDFVSLHLPLTEQTKYMINDGTLAKMKNSAYLINLARGGVVNEAALIRALKQKQIAGASLDVFEGEPKVNSELLDIDNLILTPHVGGFTYGSVRHNCELVEANVRAVVSGKQPVVCFVNKQAFGKEEGMAAMTYSAFTEEEILAIPAANHEVDEYIQNNRVTKKCKNQFHFTAPTGWINDPNGFSIYKGKYHLFYQYYPYAPEWGTMHWGHAVSGDLIRWEHKPLALAPGEEFDLNGCYSGTAIELEGQHVLLYTGHINPTPEIPKTYRQVQNIAVGDGESYRKFKYNPIITSGDFHPKESARDFRDPKIWEEDGMFYLLAGKRSADNCGELVLFASKDMRAWEYIGIVRNNFGDVGAMWECPDYFRISGRDILLMSPTEIQPQGYRYSSGRTTIYFVGEFSKQNCEFKAGHSDEIDYGLDFYAPQMLSGSKKRNIMIAWMQMWKRNIPSAKNGWAGSMTIPREVSLQGNELYQNPVQELEAYRKNKIEHMGVKLEAGQVTRLQGIEGRCCDLGIDITLSTNAIFELRVMADKAGNHYASLAIDAAKGLVTFDRSNSESGIEGLNKRTMPIEMIGENVKIRMLIDRFATETFLQGGRYAMTNTVYPKESSDGIVFCCYEGSVVLNVCKWELVF